MAEAGTKNNRPVIKRDIKKHPDKVFFDMHSGRSVTTGNRDTPILSCQCGEEEIRTLEKVTPLLVFETSAFDHSATSPGSVDLTILAFWTKNAIFCVEA